ncbi:MAG: hypothetical protein B6D59_02745 [Campylobacteraceae bacterium 4484_4]|nr:MAG: hypothetical protein B6D59_02745 [Campylobacteraceae bacterium 4484_4]
MHHLKIDLGNCVRVYSKNAACDLCAQSCPENAIFFNENILKVEDSCIDCGGCIGICPTEAISLPDFNTLDFIFAFLENEESLLSCKKNLPCLATLGVEHLVSLALLGRELILDIGHCSSCEIKDPLFDVITHNIDEANRFLEALENGKKIKAEEIACEQEPHEESVPERRAFLQRLSLKGALRSKAEFERAVEEIDKRGLLTTTDTANIRKKEVPNRRKLLFMALRRIDKPERYRRFEAEELSFISQKRIDEKCDNCSICYRVCPTGALHSDQRGTKILFDTLSCVKCRLCHDVCEPNAIDLEEISTKSFFEPKVTELKKFNLVRCDECANYFTYLGGETICPRCKIEEEEAKSLWGIQ